MAFRPHSLPLDLWPIAHQDRWAKANQAGGLFKPSGLAAHWRPASARKTAKGWGVWLGWNIEKGHAIQESTPEAMVTRQRVDAYLTDVEDTNTGWRRWPHRRSPWRYAKAASGRSAAPNTF
jgi:hypothetical protein